MPRALPVEIRERVVAARAADHETIDQLAHRFLISRSSVKRFLATDGAPAQPPGHRPRLLSPAEEEFIACLLSMESDLFLDELQERVEYETGRRVSLSTLCRTMQRLQWSNKCLQHVASQRNESLREHYQAVVARLPGESMVFLDEVGIDQRGRLRRRGWAPIGACKMSTCACD